MVRDGTDCWLTSELLHGRCRICPLFPSVWGRNRVTQLKASAGKQRVCLVERVAKGLEPLPTPSWCGAKPGDTRDLGLVVSLVPDKGVSPRAQRVRFQSASFPETPLSFLQVIILGTQLV